MKIFTRILFVFIFALFGLLFTKQEVLAAGTSLEFRHEKTENNKIYTSIYLVSDQNTITSVTADFSYPSDKLKIESITPEIACSNVTVNDIGNDGFVSFSCFSQDGMKGENKIAVAVFDIAGSGEATLVFTKDVLAIDALTSFDVLTSAESGHYIFEDQIDTLPITGDSSSGKTTSDVNVLVIVFISMVGIFTLMGFSIVYVFNSSLRGKR